MRQTKGEKLSQLTKLGGLTAQLAFFLITGMRLTLVITQLGRGGAERFASTLASAWARGGHSVTLVTIDSGETPAYALAPQVTLKRLGVHGVSTNPLQALARNIGRLKALRTGIIASRPEVVIGVIDVSNILSILATRFLGLPVIVCEQTDPLLYDIGRIWSILRRLVYPLCSALVCPAQASLTRFQSITRVRGRVIPNPVDVPEVSFAKRDQRIGYTLAAMGRLVRQKGFDLLITAFSAVANRHPDWKLVIFGDGPLLEELRAQARSMKLEDRVRFPGAVTHPFTEFQRADLFVLSSRFEGFGMVLVEAMASGLPVVSFDCPEGPSEIIRHGIDGLLVPAGDVSALASSLDLLMKDGAYREALANRAPEVTQRFALSKVLKLWENLFQDIMSGRAV